MPRRPDDELSLEEAVWFNENVVKLIPEDTVEATTELKKNIKGLRGYIQDYLEEGDDPPVLEARDLDIWDVEEIFDLKLHHTNPTHPVEDLFDVPEELTSVFQRFKGAIGKSCRRSHNEGVARSFVDLLWAYCLLEERDVAGAARGAQEPSLTSAIPMGKKKKDRASASVSMDLYFKIPLEREVKYRGEKHILSGVADIAIGYQQDKNITGTPMVAKIVSRDRVENVYGPLLANMCMIREARKADQEENTVIWGLATDGVEYRFFRIGNDSTVPMSALYTWQREPHRKQIYSLIRSIVRGAFAPGPKRAAGHSGADMDTS